MISNRDVIVVWLQRILWPAVHCAHTERMIPSGIEVGVIADEHGQVHRHILLSMKCRLPKRLVIPQRSGVGGILRQQVDDRTPYRGDSLPSSGGKSIQRCLYQPHAYLK